jgi:hypothetical protein
MSGEWRPPPMVAPQSGAGWHPDRPVMYRTDLATGERVGVIPAMCRRGLHLHRKLGYASREDAQRGVLVIECSFCVNGHLTDGYWTLDASARQAWLAAPAARYRAGMVSPSRDGPVSFAVSYTVDRYRSPSSSATRDLRERASMARPER